MSTSLKEAEEMWGTYCVYWLDVTGRPCCEQFGAADLTKALQTAAQLRREGCVHVTLSSQVADCTSLPGVSDPPADYDWKKRRK